MVSARTAVYDVRGSHPKDITHNWTYNMSVFVAASNASEALRLALEAFPGLNVDQVIRKERDAILIIPDTVTP